MEKMRIALDAMGGDFAPINEVHGAIKATRKYFPHMDIEIVFIGNEKKILAALSQFEYSQLNYSIVHTDEKVTMDDGPSVALKKKRNSSLYKGLEMHRNQYVDAFISAGNTGAVLSTATVLLGKLEGVSRPTIGSFFPTRKKHPTFVLDVGANIVCKPKFLYEFAVMGAINVTQTLGVENPRVALLNIGEETSKGTKTIQEAYELLQNSGLNFVGNVEGRDILQGTADVIVTDGLSGNIVLKFAESFVSFMKSKLVLFGKKNIFNLGLLAVVIKPIIKKMFKSFDYQEHGGVPLLGVNGNVIIGHGKSSAKAIQYMIYKAVEMKTNDVNTKIKRALSPISVMNNK